MARPPTSSADPVAAPRSRSRAGRDTRLWAGLLSALLLMALAMAVPALTGWKVYVRWFPPLHADWDPRVGPGTLPAVLIGAVATATATDLAERLSWRRLLGGAFLLSLVWMLVLALVDGLDGIGVILQTSYEYLATARSVTDVGATLHEYVSRISFDAAPHNWPVHVAGHPPGALLFFVLLVRVGLGSGLAAGLAVTVVAATTSVAVLVLLRTLGAERVARRAAPFLVLGPAAVWQCVSADAVFAAVAAWGLAALALSATRERGSAPARRLAQAGRVATAGRGPGAGPVARVGPVGRAAVGWAAPLGWAVLAGLLLGYAVMMSYGLPLLGILALTVLWTAGSWRPLPVAAVAALAVVAAFAVAGFRYWEALPQLQARYWGGVASARPAAYWMWGDLAALCFSAGPLVGAGLAAVLPRSGQDGSGPDAVPATERTVACRVAVAGWLTVLAADASQMSRAEVERIWLPFVPWLLVACALLPDGWRRRGLALQVAVALLVQHLLATGW